MDRDDILQAWKRVDWSGSSGLQPAEKYNYKRIKKAIETYAMGAMVFEVVLMSDESRLGSGKQGILMTEDMLYISEDKTEIPLEDLEKVYEEDGSCLVFRYADGKEIAACVNAEVTRPLCEMMNLLIASDSSAQKQEQRDQTVVEVEERPMTNLPLKPDDHYTFISYCHKNMAVIKPILDRLQADGYRIWYDEGIEIGSEWAESIATSLDNADSMLAFMSREYTESSNCKDELEYAKDCDKPRLLVYIDDVQLTGGMKLRHGRLQALFYQEYEDKEQFYRKLYSTPVFANTKR